MILGFSEGFHDAAIALIDENTGDIVHASHAERSSGVKHDKKISQWQKEYVSQFEVTRTAFYEQLLWKRTRQFYAGQFKTALTGRQLSFKANEFFPHHLCHAAASFQTSPYAEAACVVVDSIGEWDTISIWKASYNTKGEAEYTKVYDINYPQSVGLWYSALTKYVGLAPLDEEYIFMGMAAYGTRNVHLQSLLRERLHGHNNHRGIPEGTYSDYSNEDIAYNAQVVLEETLDKLFTKAKQFSENICYSGGVALNCVANGKMMAKYGEMWIMPNPGDAGSAIGAAALAYKKKVNWTSPYLGYDIDRPISPAHVANYLKVYKMCGVANGRAEFGPRALGNRSLLADPRDPNIKDFMNNVKRRQLFRPFAPAILEEFADEYFSGVKSKYMQTTAFCRYPDRFPGIVHADGSSRVQVVSKDDPTILRQILEAWYEKTGCPMLLNTSLNIRGKPMVDTWDDAIAFSKEYGILVF